MATKKKELTINETADLLGIKPVSVRKAAFKGTLKSRIDQTPRGAIRYVTPEDAEEYRTKHMYGQPDGVARAGRTKEKAAVS